MTSESVADFASEQAADIVGIPTYLADLLTRLVNGWPQSRIDELMPWHWPATT